ncbi:class I SAM-dependent methyltransferase [Sporocytophaga myxococcoides]|uniref:class I SAM-dependent methyltransferase n=1 Tax=Sporocytophaga myxococcoides TaxID=153721 RepID=UPI00040595CE|nr:class I SAM-dependent methyltransferase [Sporocytophaga myxococcoides]
MIKIKDIIEIPKENEITSVEDHHGEFMHNLIKDNNLKSTLEIGFAYGKSGAYIMSATQGHHVAIDPFQDDFKNIGVENIGRIGLSQHLELHRDFSHMVLPQLLKEDRRFDFVFIDGDHRFDGIFIDFYYSDLLLNPGGFILFHDTWMRSTCMVESFIRNNRKDYKYIKIKENNLCLIQKVGKDNREWMHFKEFYTLKSFWAYKMTIKKLKLKN